MLTLCRPSRRWLQGSKVEHAMALECRGVPIMSQGEFRELMDELGPRADSSGVLTGWFAGEEVVPEALYAALDIGARLQARSERAHELIDAACGRIEGAFPETRA
jgi:hypothetical protein